jgi:SNF family Na+-dependent transporter
MTPFEIFGVTINAALLAIFYTVVGGVVSYIFYHIFDECDDDWKKRSTLQQTGDVCLEISLVAIIAFWTSRFIEKLPPFIPVNKQLDILVDSYISGIFFIFAIFLFIDELTDKLKYLHNKFLGQHASRIFPQHGSLIDFSLSYSPKRTDKDVNHQD